MTARTFVCLLAWMIALLGVALGAILGLIFS